VNIPNLDFEISLAISFWNSPSKIDWFKSLPSEGTLSIIVWVVLIIAFFIQYSGQQMKLWQIIWIPWIYYSLKVWQYVTFNNDLNVFIGGFLGLLAMVLVLSPMFIGFHFADRIEKKKQEL
tara:strand:- start:8 stop:370 length:363 start_codon:yes stop_codon:yes gene_type:complete